jgi:hypothetical protein
MGPGLGICIYNTPAAVWDAMEGRYVVMAGFIPAIHVFAINSQKKTWMPGTRPGMTVKW